jgi:hypothetical protein
MAVRVRDLPDSAPYGTVLHCPRCGSDYSADAGDYFMAKPDMVFKCCGVNSRLVTKQTTYREVRHG